MTPLPTLILLPGLNGEPRVFAPQTAAFPDTRPVRWIASMNREGLATYAGRLAGSLGRVGPCAVVGVSFGGLVATELARHIDAKACVVIASSRDPAGLPPALRGLRFVAPIVPFAMLRAGVTTATPNRGDRPNQTPTDRAFRLWAISAMVTWRPPGPPPCPVVQVHGDRDRQFPVAAARADHVVRGGGHLLTLTHADEVNAILADVVRRHAS